MIYSIDIEDTDLSIPGCREKSLKNNKELRKYRRENNKVSDLVFSFGQYRRGGRGQQIGNVDFNFIPNFYSQHVIIVLVGNKSWVKEHTNGY